MSDRPDILRLRKAVKDFLGGKFDSAILQVEEWTLPRVSFSQNLRPALTATKPLAAVIQRGFSSERASRNTFNVDLLIDIGVYRKCQPTDTDETTASDHFTMVENIVKLLQGVDMTQNPAGGSTEVTLVARFKEVAVDQYLNGEALDQHKVLVTVITITYTVNVLNT